MNFTGQRSSFLAFAAALALTLGMAGLVNYLIDPLWFRTGNQLTGRNFAFNERISKINFLRRTDLKQYDCLILGSSRVVTLRPSRFEGERCYNLALKGAEVPEILAYARYALQLGLDPKVVYVGIDDFNFIHKKETERRSHPIIESTPDFLHAYFSIDVLTFSLMTLGNVSPDPDNYYDKNFEMREFRKPHWKPELYDPADAQCDETKVQSFAQLRKIFPHAKLIGFTPPMAPARQISEIYKRGVLDCELDALYEVAKYFDAFFDFDIPSPLTLDSSNTVDGAHFTPSSNDWIADELQERRSDLALNTKSFESALSYREEVRKRLKAYLASINRLDMW